MTPKEEAKQIAQFIDEIVWNERVEGNEDSYLEMQIPSWVALKISSNIIDRMTHVKNSITKAYWKDVKRELVVIYKE